MSDGKNVISNRSTSQTFQRGILVYLSFKFCVISGKPIPRSHDKQVPETGLGAGSPESYFTILFTRPRISGMQSVYFPPFLLCPGKPVFGNHGVSPPDLHLDLSTPCLIKAVLPHKVHCIPGTRCCCCVLRVPWSESVPPPLSRPGALLVSDPSHGVSQCVP